MPTEKRSGAVAYVCSRCKHPFNSLTNFYKANNGIYSNIGYIPFCKKCMNDLFAFYVGNYGDIKKAIKRMCMLFDLYYNDSLLDSSNTSPEKILGNYIRMLNIIQYRNKCFDTTLKHGFYFDEDDEFPPELVKKMEEQLAPKEVEEVQGKEIIEVNQDDIDKWGSGFDEDYAILNSHYKKLKEANPNYDDNQEIFINDLCYIHMQKMKALREGRVDDYNKLTESYRKSFQQAGLKTVRDKSKDAEFTIGVNEEIIEKYTPAEYYKNKKLYKDFDNIGDYIKRYLLRPLRNLQYGTKDRDKEFFVEDEDDELNG